MLKKSPSLNLYVLINVMLIKKTCIREGAGTISKTPYLICHRFDPKFDGVRPKSV